MMKLIVVLCLVAVFRGSSASSLEESLYGTYKLIYRWPKISRQIPNCSEAVISRPSAEALASVSCQCDRSGHQAVLHVEAPGKTFDFFTEIVTDPADLQQALDNKCTCTSDKARSVIYKVNDDYILQYLPWIPTVFLHGKVVPSAEERAELINQFPDVRDKEGNLFCV